MERLVQIKPDTLIVVAAVIAFTTVTPGQQAKPKTATMAAPTAAKKPCAANLGVCPDEGCGTKFDPNLNKLKNIVSDDQPATVRTLTWMKKLDDPESFADGESREELTELGEGQKVAVVAYVLVAKPELGGES